MTICLRAAHEHAACSRDVGNAAALEVDSILMDGAGSKSYGLKRRASGGLYTHTLASSADAQNFQSTSHYHTRHISMQRSTRLSTVTCGGRGLAGRLTPSSRLCDCGDCAGGCRRSGHGETRAQRCAPSGSQGWVVEGTGCLRRSPCCGLQGQCVHIQIHPPRAHKHPENSSTRGRCMLTARSSLGLNEGQLHSSGMHASSTHAQGTLVHL